MLHPELETIDVLIIAPMLGNSATAMRLLALITAQTRRLGCLGLTPAQVCKVLGISDSSRKRAMRTLQRAWLIEVERPKREDGGDDRIVVRRVDATRDQVEDYNNLCRSYGMTFETPDVVEAEEPRPEFHEPVVPEPCQFVEDGDRYDEPRPEVPQDDGVESVLHRLPELQRHIDKLADREGMSRPRRATRPESMRKIATAIVDMGGVEKVKGFYEFAFSQRDGWLRSIGWSQLDIYIIHCIGARQQWRQSESVSDTGGFGRGPSRFTRRASLEASYPESDLGFADL